MQEDLLNAKFWHIIDDPIDDVFCHKFSNFKYDNLRLIKKN